MSATTSPQKDKVGWVKFDNETSKAVVQEGSPPPPTPSRSSSSGVSSARGSVNSAVADEVDFSHQGGVLAVSETRVVDEHITQNNGSVVQQQPNSHPVVFQQMSSTPSSPTKASTTTIDMLDNVNLHDETIHSPSSSNSVDNIRGRRFTNGEPIVTLLPCNERLPWITPARFRPELVPEELMAPILTLTVEDYVQTMEKLTTDMRFTIYNICYKRILIIWIVTAFIIILAILFSGDTGLTLFAYGVAWLILNACAIFFCMWVKLRLNKQMEKCMASVNSTLIKHNIILGVDDRGKLSCHKVNLCFIYFESADCIKRLASVLAEKPEDNKAEDNFDREAYLRDIEEFEDIEVVVAGRSTTTISNSVEQRNHERAEKLFLHYIQRWAKDFLRRRLDWVIEDLYGRSEYASNTNPRHLRTALCPCQYIEEHLRNKRQRESLNPCAKTSNPCHWCE